MKAIGKGLLVVAITIILFGIFIGQARAGTPEELGQALQGVMRVYKGSCWFDKTGTLTFKREDLVRAEACNVGMKIVDGQLDTTVHYIMVFQGDVPRVLYAYNEKTGVQTTVWQASPPRNLKKET